MKEQNIKLGKNEVFEDQACPKCGGHLVTKHGEGISCTFCLECDYDEYDYDM